MFTEATLRKLWPRGDSKVPGLVHGIAWAASAVFNKYDFDLDGPEIAQAMAQFSHECGAGTEMTENINYTAKRAVEVWPTRFESEADCYNKVGSWPGDPDFPGKLIDSVYGTRMGNRPGTHDGRTYIGRGLAQTTGREGYANLEAKLNLPLLEHPELVNDPANALECGVADFVLCGCLAPAKADDIYTVTKRLNGGTVGLNDRKAWLAKWKAALAAQPKDVEPQPAPQPTASTDHTRTAALIAAAAAAVTAIYHYFFGG